MQVPYEVQEVNILKGAHKDPEFAKLQVTGTRQSPFAHARLAAGLAEHATCSRGCRCMQLASACTATRATVSPVLHQQSTLSCAMFALHLMDLSVVEYCNCVVSHQICCTSVHAALLDDPGAGGPGAGRSHLRVPRHRAVRISTIPAAAPANYKLRTALLPPNCKLDFCRARCPGIAQLVRPARKWNHAGTWPTSTPRRASRALMQSPGRCATTGWRPRRRTSTHTPRCVV